MMDIDLSTINDDDFQIDWFHQINDFLIDYWLINDDFPCNPYFSPSK